MNESYDYKTEEEQIIAFWDKNNFFSPKIETATKPFSIFLVPPNASGPMHVGNAFMIAIQDILARHNRSKGTPTLWVPGTDHGGYETEITFEKHLESMGDSKNNYTKSELFAKINSFVNANNNLIKDQIKRLGGSVDWGRFRYSMDDVFVDGVYRMFKKMISDELIVRKPAMIHFCPQCSTTLSDIELKESLEEIPHYITKFYLEGSSEDYIPLATTRPEFLFSVTHVLVHPHDKKRNHLIGKRLVNPITKDLVQITESKRRFDPQNQPEILSPLMPACIKFDYEYAVMHNIPVHKNNYLDWEGKMTEKYLQQPISTARQTATEELFTQDAIEKIKNSKSDFLYCKKGHPVESMLAQAWFLELDKENNSLKQQALNAISRNPLSVFPQWRETEILKYIKMMRSWPIGRQNVWGIKIPIWYNISNPSEFLVWFTDKEKNRQHGNLQTFLTQGITITEIEEGLERIYTDNSKLWSFEKQAGKQYLPETDVFDAWFSGIWSALVFGRIDSEEYRYFYPNYSIVIGHDLVRLCVAREIVVNYYLTKQLPFKHIYFHNLINGPDGKKMSKSYGNVVTLENFLEKYGADVTRLTLVSYTNSKEDFTLEENRFAYYQEFIQRLWKVGRVVEIANKFTSPNSNLSFRNEGTLDTNILSIQDTVNKLIDNFSFTTAQKTLVDFLSLCEEYINTIVGKSDQEQKLVLLKNVFEKYLKALHPFVPFVTESLHKQLYNQEGSLSL